MNGTSSVSLGEGNPDSESLDKSNQTILEEVSLSNQELTDQDVIGYAKTIGINPDSEPDLLWIARRGLLADLPAYWIPVQDNLGRIYFYNKITGRSTWTHPVDRYLRSFVRKKRSEVGASKMTNRLNPLANLRFLDDELDLQRTTTNKVNNKQSIGLQAKNPSTRVKGSSDDRLTLSSLDSEDDDNLDSIQFELDEEAFKVIDESQDEDDVVTLDVTEGGPCDVKNFHEIYTIDLTVTSGQDEDAKIENDGKLSRKDRPKSARHPRPNLNDLPKQVKDEVKDDSEEDSLSLKNLEDDPFASEDVGMFQLAQLIAGQMVNFSSSPLETLPEEADEDVKDDEEEEEEEEDNDDDDEFEIEEADELEKESENYVKGEKEDESGKMDQKVEIEFKKLSDKLAGEIKKLQDELFSMVKGESEQVNQQLIGKFKGIEKRLEENEKNLAQLKSSQGSKVVQTSLQNNSSIDVSNISKEISQLTVKVDKISVNCKENLEEERKFVRKNLDEVKDEFKVTLDQFRDFKKDNDLAIKSLRKQLNEVSSNQENLEDVTMKIKNDVQKIAKDLVNIQSNPSENENFKMEIRQIVSKERDERSRLGRSVEDVREMIKQEISKIERSLTANHQEVKNTRDSMSDEMKEVRIIINDLSNEIKLTQSSVDGKIEEAIDAKLEKKLKETIKDNQVNPVDQEENGDNKQERLILMEKSLQLINEKLDQMRTTHKRENKFHGTGSRTKKSFPSSCSSYEEESLSSSEETPSLERRKEFVNRPRNTNYPGHNSHRSPSSRSKLHLDYGFGRRREYLKYSPLHFSPILITGQPKERLIDSRAKSSSSLLAMIRKTSRLLKDETDDLNGLGNYRFISNISNGGLRNDLDADESAIRKLKQIRCDIDEKLKKLNTMVNQPTSNQ